jgi:hypothetical protein
MIKKYFAFATFASLLTAFAASAHADVLRDYQCTIERTASSQYAEGKPQQDQDGAYIGKQFSVNRQSGVMTGTLKNAYLAQPVVLDHGSNENAFKAVTTFKQGVGSSISVINVSEFADAPKKPFIYTSDSEAYFGHCLHY